MNLNVGNRVAVREYIHSDKWLFGHVEDKLGALHYHVKLDDGRTWKRHIDQIREIGSNTPLETNKEFYPCNTERSMSQIPLPNNVHLSLSTNASNNENTLVKLENDVSSRLSNHNTDVEKNVDLDNGTRAVCTVLDVIVDSVIWIKQIDYVWYAPFWY